MSRFIPLLLFLGLAVAVYLPQSEGQQDVIGGKTVDVKDAVEGAVKERSAEVVKPVEPERVSVAASPDTAEAPLDASGPPDMSSAANGQGEDAPTEAEDAAAAKVENADADAVIADTEQSEAGHIPSAANTDEIGPELDKLSLFDLKTSAQKHLARLGCYDARIDGVWGPKSRAALAEFNEHLNDDWEEPNAELIQALRAVSAAVCERECVAGTADHACTVASTSAAPEANDKGDSSARSYLPPWMHGK